MTGVPSGGREWQDAGHVERYVERTLPGVPAVAAGHVDVLRELIPAETRRVLDLGCGDGRLLAVVMERAPRITGVGLDFSPPMLARAADRFGDDARISFLAHDLADPLPHLGRFDLIVSGFAIHHLEDDRKIALTREIFDRLEPEGLFINIEHVASETPRLHDDWMHAMGIDSEDPSNRCVTVGTQLTWLRNIGFVDVDCLWKWREMALLVARRPSVQ